MDRMKLEEKILEFQELNEESTWSFRWIMTSAMVGIGGMTVFKMRKIGIEHWKIIGLGTGFCVVFGGTIAIGNWWFRRKIRTIRRIIQQFERTKIALNRRKQVYFSVSMRIPRHRNPLVLRSCRTTVSAIELLIQSTEILNNGSTWKDLYSEEIQEITMRSSKNPNLLRIEECEETDDMDFDAVFEALIAVFKLHASEYTRVLIIDLLNSSKFDFQKFQMFVQTCNKLQELENEMEKIERLALKSEARNYERSEKTKNRMTIEMEIDWRQQTSMALEAILESLESESISRSEVELSLHKTLISIGTDKSIQRTENSEKVQLKSNDQNTSETVVIEIGNGGKTDIDMVFEGIPLSESDKIASKSAIGRDVLLDGSDSRRHEKSLFGELQMVLEPRRNDFAKRERAALAKFYGIEEDQLEKEEKEKVFEGVGDGGDDQSEAYDWRKDAEESAGIHQEADNDDFLKALSLRRVEDDIIE
uniref:Uncharacterized protein n=1 Tax=Caenorhabditis tropicalis TaxID=1561998 RepID=A0A1I7UNN7_9PELO